MELTYNQREKTDLSNGQNKQVGFMISWMLTNVEAKRIGKLGVWKLGRELMWLSVGLLRADPRRRWDWNKALKEVRELRKFPGGRDFGHYPQQRLKFSVLPLAVPNVMIFLMLQNQSGSSGNDPEMGGGVGAKVGGSMEDAEFWLSLKEDVTRCQQWQRRAWLPSMGGDLVPGMARK